MKPISVIQVSCFLSIEICKSELIDSPYSSKLMHCRTIVTMQPFVIGMPDPLYEISKMSIYC